MPRDISIALVIHHGRELWVFRLELPLSGHVGLISANIDDTEPSQSLCPWIQSIILLLLDQFLIVKTIYFL